MVTTLLYVHEEESYETANIMVKVFASWQICLVLKGEPEATYSSEGRLTFIFVDSILEREVKIGELQFILDNLDLCI